MQQTIVLWHRAGLGDHIIAAGLVNWLAQKHQKVHVIVSKKHNWASVRWMFASLPQVVVVTMDSPSEEQVTRYAESIRAPLLTAMFDYPLQTQTPAWLACYQEHGLDYRTRYQLWPRVQDGPRSQEVYDLLVKPKRSFRVVHASSSERPWFDIDLPDAEEHMDTIYVNEYVSSNIFDWSKVLVNAQQIHVIDSSFLHLVASLDRHLQGQVFFHHIKAHGYFPNPETDLLSYHPKWQIINYPVKQWIPGWTG